MHFAAGTPLYNIYSMTVELHIYTPLIATICPKILRYRNIEYIMGKMRLGLELAFRVCKLDRPSPSF